ADDGIRVFHVTGVQTCALPICRRPGDEVGPAVVDDDVPSDGPGGVLDDLLDREPHAAQRLGQALVTGERGAGGVHPLGAQVPHGGNLPPSRRGRPGGVRPPCPGGVPGPRAMLGPLRRPRQGCRPRSATATSTTTSPGASSGGTSRGTSTSP